MQAILLHVHVSISSFFATLTSVKTIIQKTVEKKTSISNDSEQIPYLQTHV